MPRDDTLIVSATYDDSYPEWYDALPEPKIRQSTAEGGHPSQAFIRAYRFDRARHHSYLFIQDSLELTFPAPVGLFQAESQIRKTPAVAWARFPMFFDTKEQEYRVVRQYPYVNPYPTHGIFGPIFYIERKTMERLDKYGLFPLMPENKMDAQGTERAWAFALASIGVTPAHLHEWSNEFLASGDAAPFKKTFAGRE